MLAAARAQAWRTHTPLLPSWPVRWQVRWLEFANCWATAADDGMIRLWDPCGQKFKAWVFRWARVEVADVQPRPGPGRGNATQQSMSHCSQ
jgi:hypothetical protein